ncbi:MAG: hypothetical protein K6G90_08870 [Clostridia bacterium]|nr:hypothetical protein [Clostridia bacterium]
MKRSHENDTHDLTRLVAIVVVFAVCVVSLCGCLTAYKMSQFLRSGGSVASGTAGASSGSSASGSSSAQSGSPASGAGGAGDAAAPADSGNNDTAAALAKYTEVMDNLKANGTGGKKLEYMTLGDYDMGTVASLILPIAKGMIPSEDKAEEKDCNSMQSDMPVLHTEKGCLLTDVSALKSGSIVDNGDGTSTVTIVLNEETNPVPAEDNATSCPSIIGSVFAPMSKSGIDETVAKFSSVLTVNKLDLVYHDCKAEVKYNNDTNQPVEIYQYMYITINADAKAAILPVSGYANLDYVTHIYNITF